MINGTKIRAIAENEADRIVRSAAKIIFGEMKSKTYNTDVYPSNEDIMNLEKGRVVATDIESISSIFNKI